MDEPTPTTNLKVWTYLLRVGDRGKQVEKERPKHQPEAFAGALQRLLNQWTLDYYFGQQTHEVLYRETPQGPEVLAVGFDEIFARTNAMDPEAVKGLQTWTF
jgi:hypothetical protein